MIDQDKENYNKDIVILLGTTGSGKSTSINYLRGAKFTEK